MIQSLKQALANGQLTKTHIDDSVRRISALRDPHGHPADSDGRTDGGSNWIDAAKTRQLAQCLAPQSAQSTHSWSALVADWEGPEQTGGV